MDYSLQQRTELIIAECIKTSSTNPYEIFNIIAHKDFVSTQGPEHHVLDGACILTAFYNAGGVVELDTALQKLMSEGLKMPGAVCGLWGVCGAVMSIGAALAIIDGSGPLSTEDWGSHMEYTSQALTRLAKIGGPRCCKRDAFSSMELAIGYIKKRYGITLDMPHIKCDFASKNAECIGERCPYNI